MDFGDHEASTSQVADAGADGNYGSSMSQVVGNGEATSENQKSNRNDGERRTFESKTGNERVDHIIASEKVSETIKVTPSARSLFTEFVDFYQFLPSHVCWRGHQCLMDEICLRSSCY